jgi:hypothetical protein
VDNRGLYTVAMQRRKHNLTDEQVQEMLQAYRDKTMSTEILCEMYGIGTGSFYRILQNNGVKTHRANNGQSAGDRSKNGKVKITKIAAEEFDLPQVIEVPLVHTAPVEVVVDSNSLVQTAKPVRRLNATWEVRYTGQVTIEADDIEEAIREARKLGVVKRIYSVKIKGQ